MAFMLEGDSILDALLRRKRETAISPSFPRPEPPPYTPPPRPPAPTQPVDVSPVIPPFRPRPAFPGFLDGPDDIVPDEPPQDDFEFEDEPPGPVIAPGLPQPPVREPEPPPPELPQPQVGGDAPAAGVITPPRFGSIEQALLNAGPSPIRLAPLSSSRRRGGRGRAFPRQRTIRRY
jgi:hypothetical protein